jgi:hypothetical protein
VSRILVGQHQNNKKKQKNKWFAERREFKLHRVCAAVMNSWYKLVTKRLTSVDEVGV